MTRLNSIQYDLASFRNHYKRKLLEGRGQQCVRDAGEAEGSGIGGDVAMGVKFIVFSLGQWWTSLLGSI